MRKDDSESSKELQKVSHAISDIAVHNLVIEENGSNQEKANVILQFFKEAYPIFKEIEELELYIQSRPDSKYYFQATDSDIRKFFSSTFTLFDPRLSIDKIKNEILVLKKRLNEIVFEGFSVLQISLLTSITECRNKYHPDVIKKYYSKFYNENYHVKIETIKMNIPTYKKYRDSTYIFDSDDNKIISIESLWSDVQFLSEVLFSFDGSKSEFEKSNTTDRNKKMNDVIQKVALVILGGIVTWLASNYFL